MRKHAYLAMLMAFALGACGQDDGQQAAGGGEETAASGTQEQAASGGDSNEYFEAAAKIGEVKDSGLGYDYVIVEQE